MPMSEQEVQGDLCFADLAVSSLVRGRMKTAVLTRERLVNRGAKLVV